MSVRRVSILSPFSMCEKEWPMGLLVIQGTTNGICLVLNLSLVIRVLLSLVLCSSRGLNFSFN